MWPAGFWIAHSSWPGLLKVLFSSFLMEDHILPLHYLFGYFCYLFPYDPAIVVHFFVKFQFILMAALATWCVKELWNDSRRTLVFLTFFLMNLGMTWRNMVFPVGFNISAIFTLLAFIFFIKFLQSRASKFRWGYISFLFISTMSAETAFFGFPIFVVFVIGHFWWDEGVLLRRTWGVLVHFATIALALLPYMIIHYMIFGSLLPQSRLVMCSIKIGVIRYYSWLIFSTLSGWLFGFPDFLQRSLINGMHWYKAVTGFTSGIPAWLVIAGFAGVSFIIGFVLRYIIRNRFLTRQGACLFIAFLLQMAMILIAARYEDGLWILPGIILWMVITDIICSKFQSMAGGDKSRYGRMVNIAVIIVIAFLFIRNVVVDPFFKAQVQYGNVYAATTAAYEAIGEPAENIALIHLPGGGNMAHPVAFWIGAQISYRKPGLWFYEDRFVLYPKRMLMATYPNLKDEPFSVWRHRLSNIPVGREAIIFQDKGVFFRIFTDRLSGKIIRAVPVRRGEMINTMDLHLPELRGYAIDKEALRIGIVLAGKPSQIDKIFYGGKQIPDSDIVHDGAKLSFKTRDFTPDSRIEVNGQQVDIRLIEVEIIGKARLVPEPEHSGSGFRIISHADERSFSAISSDGAVTVRGTVSPGENVVWMPLVGKDFTISFKSIYPAPERQRPGEVSVSLVDRGLMNADLYS